MPSADMSPSDQSAHVGAQQNEYGETETSRTQPLGDDGTKPPLSEGAMPGLEWDNGRSDDELVKKSRQLQGNLPADTSARKKSKKKKDAAAQPKNQGTGFEAYYCDPPMTPAEAEEEMTLIYPPETPFVDRIEECIQRYRARRKFDNVRLNIFQKYLAVGGIDSSPRQFQGMNSIDYEETTTNERREMMATDVIHRSNDDPRWYDPSKPEDWVVDFHEVVAGFFSVRIFRLVGTDMDRIKIAAAVVENFLNYVIHHGVCPEYANGLQRAKGVCNKVVDQCRRIFAFTRDAPGDFNTACRILFYADDTEDVPHDDFEVTKDHAERVFHATVAASEALFENVKRTKVIKVIDEDVQAFEVEQISQPDEELIRNYLSVRNMAGTPGNIKSCGRVTLKPIVLLDGFSRDEDQGPAPGIDSRESIVLEAALLNYLKVGMKMRLALCTLNIGLKFIKTVIAVQPDYYVFLPQELMLTYKPPRPTNRPAPSVDDMPVEGATWVPFTAKNSTLED